MEDEDDDDPEIKNDPIYVLDLQVAKIHKSLFVHLIKPWRAHLLAIYSSVNIYNNCLKFHI